MQALITNLLISIGLIFCTSAINGNKSEIGWILDNLSRSSFFEGDINLMGRPLDAYARSPNTNESAFDLWPDGVIPYQLYGGFNDSEIALIQEAMNEFKIYSCIRWEKHEMDSDVPYVTIYKSEYPDHCSSAIGMHKTNYLRTQLLELGQHCLTKPVIIHEMMHTLGFFHEHSRADRDRYITVNLANVALLGDYRFRNFLPDRLLGTNYDYGSIMHLGEYAFSGNGLKTISPKINVAIGNQQMLSQTDIFRINKFYNCPKFKEEATCYTSRSDCFQKAMLGFCFNSTITSRCRSACLQCHTGDTCFENEVDYTWNSDEWDLSIVSSESPQDCQNRCRNFKKCQFWTWTNEIYGIDFNEPWPNKCHLKKAMGDRKFKTNLISGPAYCPSQRQIEPDRLRYNCVKNG